MKDAVVTPWEVSGDVDYDRLLREFGLQRIGPALSNKIKRVAGELHFMIRRGVFFAHRDLEWILNEYRKGNPFYLYTGRGPSENVHLGHLLPWVFTKWLQDKFKVELYFQLTDDEKFLFKEMELEAANRLAYENALDIIALGFDQKKTFIFSDLDYAKTLYRQGVKVAKKITFSTIKAVFGFDNGANVGQIYFTAMQAVPAFLPSVLSKKKRPCLIPHAIDQDAHFRIARDVLPKLGYYKPASIQCKFLPALVKGKGKMSASESKQSTIFTTDTPEEVETKIRKYAFSGGRETTKEHREKGGVPEIDVAYQWLEMFFEPSDSKLKRIYDEYKSGEMLTGELKQILIDKVNLFLKKHQERREKARDRLGKFILKD